MCFTYMATATTQAELKFLQGAYKKVPVALIDGKPTYDSGVIVAALRCVYTCGVPLMACLKS